MHAEPLSLTSRVHACSHAGEFQEIKSHQQQINRLKMTWDEQLLCTASDDGSIFVYDVRCVEAGGMVMWMGGALALANGNPSEMDDRNHTRHGGLCR